MGNISVWFVEDDGNDVFMIRRALRASGLPVSPTFFSNTEQLKSMFLLAQRTGTLPDVIVTDLKLIGDDGFCVLEWVKSLDLPEPPYLIVLTSSMLQEDRRKAGSLGAHAFITKSSGHQLTALLADTLGPLLNTRTVAAR
jgi:CheY-like chemotaxis protein